MSWNSGGPWGSNQGPQNNNNGGGRKEPPKGQGPEMPEMDVDEWLRKSQEKLRRAFPTGPNGRTPNSYLYRFIALVFLALWFASGFYQVNTNQLGVVLRFGKVVRTETPGLRFHLPEPIETVLLTDYTNEKKIEIGFRSFNGQTQDVADESRMLTGDENIVDVNFIVNWRINSAEDYLFNVRSPELTIKMASESAIREVVGRMEIQPVLTEKRLDIEQETRELAQAMLDDYKAGITITRVQLLSVAPPAEVKDAFDDVTRARADGDTARNEAEAYRNDILPRANGEAQRILNEAEGYKEIVVNNAKGDAARFADVLGAYQSAREVTSTRLYFEAMEDVLKSANKIIIDPAAGKATNSYLPLNELMRKSTPDEKTP